MLGSFILVSLASLLFSLESLINLPSTENQIACIALAGICFIVGLTEGILWAATPVQDQ